MTAADSDVRTETLTETVSETLVQTLAALLTARRARVAFAESCTGGLIAKLATDLAGSSAWFERGVVSYSNEAKHELLGVEQDVFRAHGAVSEACVRAMASGLMQRSPADWTVAVTGVAGPGGGSARCPVGTVWMAWMQRGQAVQAECHHFGGDRAAVRQQTAETALAGLVRRLQAAA